MSSDKKHPGLLFITVGLLLLLLGTTFGLIGGLQYVGDNFLSDLLPFYKTRPLHVFLITAFIIVTASGGVYYYLNTLHPDISSVRKNAGIQLFLFTLTTLIIVVCFIDGTFGGREYLEYPPVLALPILICWIIFAINYLRTVRGVKFKTAPIYYWMWGTGILFFIITYLESYLWMFPYFRDNIVRDVTVQWKSLGSMVGAWNMLIYGSGFYIMEKISGNEKTARAPLTFFFYFLGLTNLMFNWGHHTYIVPHSPYIKYTAYIISMTELLILGNIILGWRRSLTNAQKNFSNIPYRFLSASDLWIFLNLILAITISIPAVNKYSHGTHITVAHAMGATIGINTMILFASVYYIFSIHYTEITEKYKKQIHYGFWILNISLFLFWTSLLIAGFIKGREAIAGSNSNFREIMEHIKHWLHLFAGAGIGISIGLFLLALPVIRTFFAARRQTMN